MNEKKIAEAANKLLSDPTVDRSRAGKLDYKQGYNKMELGKLLNFNCNHDLAVAISTMSIIMLGIIWLILVWSRGGGYRRHEAKLPLGSLGWPFMLEINN